MIYGVDVASWQGYPDWPGLAAEGHDFMISKVTGEGAYVNPYAATNIQRARAAGLIVGAYDWVEPQGSMTGADAARSFLRALDAVAPSQPGDLLCVDFETPDWYTGPLGRDIEPFMNVYLYTLRNEGKQPVIVYTAPYFLLETGAKDWAWLAQDFHYWIAAPGPLAQLPDDAPWPGGSLVKPWGSALLHQHQWHALSSAVAGEFDRNRFQGTREQLAAHGRGGASQGGDVKEPAAGTADQYLNERGELIAVINYGGEAKEILGVDYADVGGRVRNAQGATYHRSILGGEMQGWVREPAQDQG